MGRTGYIISNQTACISLESSAVFVGSPSQGLWRIFPTGGEVHHSNSCDLRNCTEASNAVGKFIPKFPIRPCYVIAEQARHMHDRERCSGRRSSARRFRFRQCFACRDMSGRFISGLRTGRIVQILRQVSSSPAMPKDGDSAGAESIFGLPANPMQYSLGASYRQLSIRAVRMRPSMTIRFCEVSSMRGWCRRFSRIRLLLAAARLNRCKAWCHLVRIRTRGGVVSDDKQDYPGKQRRKKE